MLTAEPHLNGTFWVGSNFSINTPSGRLSSPSGGFGGGEARWTADVDK